METLTLKLPDEISHRLSVIAQRTGCTKTDYVLMALEEQLANMEDVYLATAALERYQRGEERSWTQEEIGADLNLEN